MHQSRTLAIALVVALAVAGLTACGSGDGGGERLSRSAATALRSGLDQVEKDVSNGDCEAAAAAAEELRQRAADLKRGTPDLRRALAEGFTRLDTLVRESCAPETGATGTTAPAVAETGPTGSTGNENTGQDGQKEKPNKPGKGKEKKDTGNQEPNGSPTQPPTQGGDENSGTTNDNQDSGGAAP